MDAEFREVDPYPGGCLSWTGAIRVFATSRQGTASSELFRIASWLARNSDRINSRSMSEVHVLLAADQAMVRDVLKRVIASQPDLYIVYEAEDRRSALEKARQLAPDVALIADTSDDVHAFLGEMCKSCPSTKVIELAATEDGRQLHTLLRDGAKGYVSARAGANELVAAIRTVAAGEFYVDPREVGQLIPNTHGKGRAAVDRPLTKRETEVARLLAQGFTVKDISLQLRLSLKTVETYKARSMHKLELASRVELMRTANARGWLHSR